MGSADELTPQLSTFLDRCTFAPEGTAVRCGVSGGADSIALLILAVSAGLNATAVHVDHGLRDGSATEAHLVKAVADRFGAKFESVQIIVEEGSNLEERARIARRQVLGADALTGHTADDQAETVLLQLIRGAGPSGLSGMAAGPSKPLLSLRRADTEAVCGIADVQWFEDPSNRDPRHRRNRVRHELMPLMADVADRDIVPLLNRTARHSRSSEAVIDQLLPEGDPTDTRWLQQLPEPVAALVVRRWLAGEIGRPVSTDATMRVLQVVHHERSATELDGGWRLDRSEGRLCLAPIAGARRQDA